MHPDRALTHRWSKRQSEKVCFVLRQHHPSTSRRGTVCDRRAVTRLTCEVSTCHVSIATHRSWLPRWLHVANSVERSVGDCCFACTVRRTSHVPVCSACTECSARVPPSRPAHASWPIVPRAERCVPVRPQGARFATGFLSIRSSSIAKLSDSTASITSEVSASHFWLISAKEADNPFRAEAASRVRLDYRTHRKETRARDDDDKTHLHTD